ncbi:MAG: class I SAM-dependent methyltransferase [Candidatus Cloacimonetes bacterium]|nr:class I SAM-dependent methyltransferase [Candidatus Cloacimonadota bacterium]
MLVKIKKAIRSFVPYSVYSKIPDFLLYLKSIKYVGNRYECPYCKGKFDRFIAAGLKIPIIEEKQIIGAGYRHNVICPRCLSSDRSRHLYLFFKYEKADIFKKKMRILHVAPEKSLRKYLLSQPDITYVSADLDSPIADVKMDITNIQYDENSFDMVICNHVLEHVPNDKKAMLELYRVLKPGGISILQVPISKILEKTFEDFEVVEPEDRAKVFGQKDHVRIYGKDYRSKLESVGFDVFSYSFMDEHTREEAAKYCLINDERIIYCQK